MCGVWDLCGEGRAIRFANSASELENVKSDYSARAVHSLDGVVELFAWS